MRKYALLALLLALPLSLAQAPILLNYHQIGESTLLTRSPSPQTLEQHVQGLQRNGYRLTTGSSFKNDLADGDKVALLTFDDARKSVITNALPVLTAHGVAATVFVIADLIGQDGYLTADDLLTLKAHGWEIGNHTLTHAALTDMRPGSIRRELERTNDILEEITGERPACVAYPYGLHDAVVRDIVRETNECAFTTAPLVAHQGVDPHGIPRPPITPEDDHAILAGQRARPITSTIVGLGMLTWALPDDAPVGAPPATWTPTTYRTLGDGRYQAHLSTSGALHDLSVRGGDWALHLLHGRGQRRAHAIGLARNLGSVTLAGAYVVGEGPGFGVSVDWGARTETWAYWTTRGGLHAGVRLVPLDYTTFTATYHHASERITLDLTAPLPILPGEGYPARVGVGYDQAPYASVSFRAGGNTLALRADTTGSLNLSLEMRW